MDREPTGFATAPLWFAVFPDCAAAGAAVARLRRFAECRVSHPSGRPLLLGRWPTVRETSAYVPETNAEVREPGAHVREPGAETVRAARSGGAVLALAGQQAAAAAELYGAAARSRTTEEAAAYASGVPGSFHLVTSVAGQVRVQGTLSGLRRVYAAEVDGVTVAADRADVLAYLTGAGVDERCLALHLLSPALLPPLTDRPLWRGVRCVPSDHFLLHDASGRARDVRYWSPPEARLPLSAGAPALRAALGAAVEARTAGRTVVSSDLSGLDSTSLCSLAALQPGTRVVAFTAASADPLDEDVRWSFRTTAALPGIEHRIVPHGEMPTIYEALPGMREPFDEPCAVLADHARWMSLTRRASAAGSALHLAGFGGDELLIASAAHLRTLLRRRPRTALSLLSDYSASYRWRRRHVLRRLCTRTSYRGWFRSAADALTAPPPPSDRPPLSWGEPPRLAPWATPEAVDAVRELIHEAAPHVEPVSVHPGVHDDVTGLRYAARPLRQIGQLAARDGTALAAPYLDDAVLNAVLAVRPEERRTPWSYKPLLVAALRGTVPEECFTGRTKTVTNSDPDAALRTHRAQLAALWDESRLAHSGLIDAAALRATCAGPLQHHPRDLHGGLYQTLACELWLRSLERPAAPDLPTSPPAADEEASP
ncbi:asparagine synthase-related protein [Streptomyces iconiensis]|uniref:Asparagine synthase-related protein n=1 Tax=Streptomyces iconiensis TaxID=1384038 RepID=A0ABT7A6F7_9ACTN|nr:asparagine synthase-related protein [Streptomyces iconiensis]MDJ1136928.1 asparagine synthase-related protein [Streptomyces iconiensis]